MRCTRIVRHGVVLVGVLTVFGCLLFWFQSKFRTTKIIRAPAFLPAPVLVLPDYGKSVSYNVCGGDRAVEMALYKRGDIVSDSIMRDGMFERPLICSMIEHMKGAPSGAAFVDVGSNVGAWTVALAASVPGLRIVAVEPMPNNLKLLQWTLRRNGMTSVSLVKQALSERPGMDMCTWETNVINRGNARLVPYFEGVKDFGEDKGKTCDVRVRVNTLDNVIKSTIGFGTVVWGLKLDIEGYETMVLRGSQFVLAHNRPCKIWFEYQRAVTVASGAGDSEVFRMLDSHGYEIYDVARGLPITGPLYKCDAVFDAVATRRDCMQHDRVEGSVRIGSPPYTATIPCDVPCIKGRIPNGLIRTIELPDINARITLSMEGANYYPQLTLKPKHERLASRHFQGTTDLSSDIPMPYYNWPWTRFLDEPPKLPAADLWSYNYIQHPPPPFHATFPRALFMARNCNSKNRREELVAQLKALGVPVDSLSSCLHSASPDAPSDLKNKSHVMEQYRVYFAFENQNTKDYVTEKLWGAFASGTIPVYYGAPNIATFIPENSAILLSSFPSLKDAAHEIMQAMTNPAVNAFYHQWRYKALPDAFVRMWNFTHVHSECRTCRFVRKMKGIV